MELPCVGEVFSVLCSSLAKGFPSLDPPPSSVPLEEGEAVPEPLAATVVVTAVTLVDGVVADTGEVALNWYLGDFKSC